MNCRSLAFSFILVGLLGAAAPAQSDELTDLQATFAQAVAALNAKDLDGFLAMRHEQYVAFLSRRPLPVVGKAAFRQAFERLFATYEEVMFAPLKPQYQVIGQTGLVWGLYTIALQPKDGPLVSIVGRMLFTFVKSEGQWVIVGEHVSVLPSGN